MKWLCKLNESEKFWDVNQTWHTDNPDFSWCFHYTILYWIPCFYLLVSLPFYILYLRRHGQGYIRMSRLSKAKTCLSALLALICYTELFYTVWNMTNNIPEPPVLLISPLIVGATMLLVTCLIQYERIRGVRSSALLLLFWILTLICAAFQLRTKITIALSQASEINRLRYTLFALYFLLVLFQSILSFFNDQPPFFTSVKDDMNPCPLSAASFLSQVTFSWFTEIMFRGYKQSLKADDIWSLRKSDTVEDILMKFSKEVQKEWHKTKPLKVCTQFSNAQEGNDIQIYQDNLAENESLLKNPSMQMNNQSLLKIIIRSFGYHYLFSALLMVLYTTLLFISPQLLRYTIAITKTKKSPGLL